MPDSIKHISNLLLLLVIHCLLSCYVYVMAGTLIKGTLITTGDETNKICERYKEI